MELIAFIAVRKQFFGGSFRPGISIFKGKSIVWKGHKDSDSANIYYALGEICTVS